jgi:HD-like signal output (HDOD) protein
MEYIRSIILTIGAFGRLKEFKVEGLCLEDFWNRSLQIAEAAKAIAISQTSSKSQAEEAYVSGLLHASGKLILYSSFPDKVKEVEELVKSGEVNLLEAETQVFGAHHSQVGAYLLGLWGLATSIVESVHWYSNPSQSVPVDFQPLTAVHVASALLTSEDEGIVKTKSSASDIFFPTIEIDEDYLEKISLLSRLEDWRFLVSGYLNPNSNRKELVSGMLASD